MTVIADRTAESPDPIQDPGTGRVPSSGEIRFYSGLICVAVLLVFGTLAVIAALPMVVPGYASASITSGSMQPTLLTGDVVIATSASTVERGEIAVFVDPRSGDVVSHRVVSVNTDGSIVTKGDVNAANDPVPVPAANIRGQVRWIVPLVGWPRVWLGAGQWLSLLITMLAMLGALWLARYGLDTRHDPWRSAANHPPS